MFQVIQKKNKADYLPSEYKLTKEEMLELAFQYDSSIRLITIFEMVRLCRKRIFKEKKLASSYL